MSDMVNSPAHYNQGEIECIDAIRVALGYEGFVAYCRGNAIKYNWRAGLKLDEKEDLRKAAWYSSMAAGIDPRKPEARPDYKPSIYEAPTTGDAPAKDAQLVPPECDTREDNILYQSPPRKKKCNV